VLKPSNSIRETDLDYNISQTTPRRYRYVTDTKKQKLWIWIYPENLWQQSR